MFKSGYTAIVGLPNVGKSTLLNAIIGEEIAITTHKPQTTRNKITGIYNDEDSQIIFLDSPGYHNIKRPLNKHMTETVGSALSDADVVIFMLDPKNISDDLVFELYKKVRDKPHLIVLNKIDKLNQDQLIKKVLYAREKFGTESIYSVSALEKNGITVIMGVIKDFLPEGPKYYPDDMFTKHNMRFLAEEIIREKALEFLHEEIPHGLAVIVDNFEEKENITVIQATIVVEKKSHKGILIVKGGDMIKKIGSAARLKIENMVGTKVYLELFVKIEKDWTKDLNKVREFVD
ncbi:GTPase Era [bacterium]|nr:GTPase Era [bacterium]